MTVTGIKLINWEGSESLESVSYALRYLVRTNDRDDGPFTVRNGTGVTYGDAYTSGNDSDPRAIALDIRESRVDPGNFLDWYVDINYGPPEERTNDNPLLDAIRESWSWAAQSRSVLVDANGDRILNTAGDPITDPIAAEDNLPALSYSLNQAAFPTALAQQVRNATNSTAWKGYPARTVKVAGITAETLFNKTIGTYYSVSYNFGIRPEGYRYAFDSFGFNELYSGGTKKRRIRVDLNSPSFTNIPWPLDASGVAIRNTSTAAAVVTVELYPEYDFNALFPFL